MASTGTISITLKSVDYPAPYTRGYMTHTYTLNYSVDDSANLSFEYDSVSYTGSSDPYPYAWFVCSDFPYHLDVEFSTDGTNWTPLAQKQIFNSTTRDCSRNWDVYPVTAMVQDFVEMIGTLHLTQSGYIRVFTYTESAAPTAELPYAYPTAAYSEAVAVPIYIEVDYFPGAIYADSTWKSHNRTGGNDKIFNGTAWIDMKTTDGASGQNNPPLIKTDSNWYNQRKIGSA